MSDTYTKFRNEVMAGGADNPDLSTLGSRIVAVKDGHDRCNDIFASSLLARATIRTWSTLRPSLKSSNE